MHPILLVQALAVVHRLANGVQRPVAVRAPAGPAEDRRRAACAVDAQAGSAVGLACVARGGRVQCCGLRRDVGRLLQVADEVAFLETLFCDLSKGFILVVVIDDPSTI